MNKVAVIVRAQPSAKARFSTNEFIQISGTGAFDDMKIELVDGELERMNPPMSDHSVRLYRLAELLMPIARKAGMFALGETGIEIAADTIRACDAAIVHALPVENRMFRGEDIMLAIEVAQTTSVRDLGRKREDYASIGIPHYWVVDPIRLVTHVFAEPIDGDYALVHTVRFGAPLAVPGTDDGITID